MVFRRHAKWFFAATGGGIAIIFSYLQYDRKCVQTDSTPNNNPSVKWDYNWDKRDVFRETAKYEDDPKEQNRMNEEKKSTAYRHIFLIRHGQYHDSERKDENRTLTNLGKIQANYVGKRLKELGYNYTKFTYSTMTRAKETSEIILKYFPDIPTNSDDLLREGSPIPPEPPSGSYRPEYKFFRDGARIEAAFKKYFHRADPEQTSPSYEIIVCHANVIRYFLCRALQLTPEAWLRFGLHHCSITMIYIAPSGEVGAVAVGDHGFMPKEYLSKC